MAINKEEQANTVVPYSCPNPKATFENCIINLFTFLNLKDYYEDTKSEFAIVGNVLSTVFIKYHEICGNSTRPRLNDIMLGVSQLECYNENDGGFTGRNLLHMIIDILPVDAKQIYSLFQMKVYTENAIAWLKLKAPEILPQNGENSKSAKFQNIFVTNLSKDTIATEKLPRKVYSGIEKTVKQLTKINHFGQIYAVQNIQMFDVRGRCKVFFVSKRYACYGNSGTQQLYEENIFAYFGPNVNFLIAFGLLVVQALYQKHRGLNFGFDDNQYSERRIVSLSLKSTTNVFFVIGRSKLFSSRIFDEALVISSMIYEQNRGNVENGLQIAYTLVFPNDCRMFLYVPIYQYGYIYRIDQKNNAIPVLRFEEPTNAVSMPNDWNWSGANISLSLTRLY